MAQPTGSARPSLESLLREMADQQSLMMSILCGNRREEYLSEEDYYVRKEYLKYSIVEDEEEEKEEANIESLESLEKSEISTMVKQQRLIMDLLSEVEKKSVEADESEKADVEKKSVVEENEKAEVEKNSVVETEESEKAEVEKKFVEADESERAEVEKNYVEVEEGEKAEVEKNSVIETESAESLTKEDVIADIDADNAGLCDLDDATFTQVGESQKSQVDKKSVIETESADDTSKPSDDASEPADDTSKPADDNSKPSDDASKPSDDASKPSDDASKPSDDTSKPADDNSEPADDTSKPADDNSKPSDEKSAIDDSQLTKESGTGKKELTKESGTGEKEPTKESGTGKKEPKPGTGEEALRELPCYDTLLETLKKGIYSFQTSGEKRNMKLGIGDFNKGNHARRRLLILKKLTRCQKVWIYAKEFSQMQKSMLDKYDIDDLRNELAIYNSLRTLKNGQVNLCYPYSFMLVKDTEKTFRLLINIFEKGKPWPYYCEGERKNYFVFLMEYGGITLETAIKSRLSYENLLVLFRQICIIFAIGEEEIELLHDDLHINNVLVAETEEKLIKYEVASKKIKIPTLGYIAKVIDFGNARCIKDIDYRLRMISEYGKRPCPAEYSRGSLFMLSGLYFEMINTSLELRAALPELPRLTTSLQLYEGLIQILKDLAILEFLNGFREKLGLPEVIGPSQFESMLRNQILEGPLSKLLICLAKFIDNTDNNCYTASEIMRRHLETVNTTINEKLTLLSIFEFDLKDKIIIFTALIEVMMQKHHDRLCKSVKKSRDKKTKEDFRVYNLLKTPIIHTAGYYRYHLPGLFVRCDVENGESAEWKYYRHDQIYPEYSALYARKVGRPKKIIGKREKLEDLERSLNHQESHHGSDESGGGRTGVFLAVEWQTRQLELEAVAAVYQCVNQLRLQRGSLVHSLKLEYSLDAQAIKRSRRLQRLEPEENIAMVNQETQTKMSEYHFQPFRNPSIFTGERNQNPEKWLKEFHRVARYNCWDDSMCLANVYFFLQGTAHRWYENVEEKINSWDIFVKMFSQNFGHHVTQKNQLAENLKTRAQWKEETSDSYIQDVLHLCREVDPAMMENEIIAHLTKGISEEIYRSMIILDIATIDEFIKWCRKIEASNKKRVNKRVVFDRLPNVAAIGSADSESMEDLVRRIVREEVHRALNPESTTPEPSSLKEIIREEIEKNVAAISKPIQRPPPRQSYPNQTRTFNQVPRRQCPTQTPIYNQTPPQRRTDEWRTHDNIPICFNCGRPGHVKRYCRERRQWTQRPEGHAPSTQEPQMGDHQAIRSQTYRRQSPYPNRGRSPRRQPPYKPIPTPLQSRKKLSIASSFEGEAAGVKNPPSSTAAKLQQNYVEIIIDDIAFSALVDSGSSFSVISDGLRRQLKKTMFKDSGMTLKVADGGNVTSIGRCTISLSINGLEQPLEFIVLPNSNPSIILGWDFLEASNAVIDCGRAEIRLEMAKDVLNSPASMGKVVASRSVVIPAESAKLINVMSEELNGQNQVIFEPSKKVSIGKGLTLPCALFRLSHNKGKLWIVNSGTTAQIVPKGMCLGKIQRVEENNLTAISECSEFNKEVKDRNHASHADKGDFRFLQNLISDDLSEEQQSQILSILKRHDKIFDKNNEPVKQTSVTKHKIETGNHQPIKHRPYRVSPTERQAIQTEVDKMLDAGIIHHSESPWSSPVILVKKKDGIESTSLRSFNSILERCLLFNLGRRPSASLVQSSNLFPRGRPEERKPRRAHNLLISELHTLLKRRRNIAQSQTYLHKTKTTNLVVVTDGNWRFCVDYRRLNKVTKKDVYPLPRIDDTLDSLKVAKFYSSMDLRSGYWQIEVDEADREKTAFITPDGLYEFLVMPFGLCNAPATFERMMDKILKGLKWTMALCYLDDIVVYSKSFNEHLHRLEIILQCLDKPSYASTPKSIYPDPEKIEAIARFPTPRSITDVRSFIGLCSYYRRFIENFAEKAAPLHEVLKKDNKFTWNSDQQDAFDSLKEALMSEPVLAYFEEQLPTELHTDASGYGIGAVLVQINDGKERPVGYASRTLSKAEKNYSTMERECLAAIWAINKFQPYLFGREFVIPPGLLKAIPPATSPFQRVGMDLLGRFPKSDTGNKWIIVCTDYLTRFAVTKTLPTGEAKEAAKFLMEDVVLKHGAPREIITDRGRVFQSKLIAELTNQCSSIHRFTKAYHPQTNGLTERLNKTLANMIAMYVSVEQKDWDVILPYVTFAYNTAKQDTTGFTPFELIHGRESETTVDTLFPNPHEDLQEDYSQRIASRVEETRQLARLETLKAQEKDKARYDSKHEAMDYNIGDLVWIFIPIRKVGLSEKVMKRYFGPYRVTRKLSDVTFEVEPVDQPTRRRQTRDLVHVLRMKPYHDPEDQADLFK
ncbi:K02A2.6-like [Cordylochernes scorpioides]|uniref:K02A2.6-like n=1 Tax=Cordylochernes scorpioides TaxID=51811 RepID=A0ABY6KBD9_9ARAC|nr:K02A2.6-like [Cordylochernes scorpioides]